MTAPSVNRGDIEGGFQVNGASGAENAFTVDGVVTNSLINGASRQDTVFEYLQEIQVKTTGVPAEMGGALGGVISAVTKSGGNTVPGRSALLPPRKRPECRAGQAASVEPDRRQDRDEHRAGQRGSEQQQRVRRLSRRPDPQGQAVVLRLGIRLNRRTNHYNFSQGTDPGEIERKQDLMQAFGKVSYGSRRLNAYGSGPEHVEQHDWYSLGIQRHRAELPLDSKAAATQKARGYEADQVSTSGSADIILSNSAVS